MLASLLMVSGSTADRLGRRRTFQAALAVFTLGSLLCSIAPGLGSLTYAVIEGPDYGWASARILSFLTVAVVALAVFAAYERRRREPLVDLRFFRSLQFSGATLTAVSAMGALGGFLFLNARRPGPAGGSSWAAVSPWSSWP